MSLTVRSINTPATTVAANGRKPKAYDIFPKNRGLDTLLGSESGSYQMVASEIGGYRGSRAKLMDNLSDAAGRKVMSEHISQ